jgi:hypothetical protein
MRKITMLLIVLTTALFSCGQNKNGTNTPIDNITTPFKIISNAITKSNYSGQEYPICFESAFSDSTFVKEITTQSTTTYSFQTISIGKIKIESGKIIACDPIIMRESKSFSNIFPIGEFNVQLAIAKIHNNNRVAYSRIVFSNNPVIKWIYATRQGEVQIPINDTTLYCYSVDAGQGLFIDSIANFAFSQKSQTQWNATFADSKWVSPNFFGCLSSFDNYNLAVFNTGYGDGCYGSFIGLDKDNKICRLLTDFGFVRWWENKK